MYVHYKYLLNFVEIPVIGDVAVVAVSHDRLRVTWDLTFDGNLPLLSCTVKYNEMISGDTNSDVLSYDVMNLDPYTQYYVQVQCNNKVGMSNILQGGPVRTNQSSKSY